jgi:hypothetical protein
MKTIFDEAIRTDLINRISSLDENCTKQWGKMNIYQMLKHCTIWDEWVLGKNNPTYKQIFIGRIFGKMALKKNVKDDRPIARNMPSGSAFEVKEKTGNVELQKKKWMSLIKEYENYSNPAFIHDFFGKMTREEIGIFAYKHSDHHLRQFNR